MSYWTVVARLMLPDAPEILAVFDDRGQLDEDFVLPPGVFVAESVWAADAAEAARVVREGGA